MVIKLTAPDPDYVSSAGNGLPRSLLILSCSSSGGVGLVSSRSPCCGNLKNILIESLVVLSAFYIALVLLFNSMSSCIVSR
jgi:hypothetical protein